MFPSARGTSCRLSHKVLLASAGAAALLAGLSPAAFSTRANAQEAEPSSGMLEEVVVTARRREERLQNVPVAITALPPATLERYAVSDLSAIGQMVPSMIVGRQATGASANIYLRGIGSTSLSAGFDQSVSISIDEIPMSRGREVVNSQFDLQQIEVLKGPQALFFGKNSSGGVIVVRTANPGPEFEASAKVGYEFEAREWYGEGVVSGPINDRLRARLAVRASRMDGYIKNVAQPGVDQFRLARQPTSDRVPDEKNLSGRLTVTYQTTERLDTTLKLGASHMQDSGATSYQERGCAAGRTTPLATFGIFDPNNDCKIDGRISIGNIPVAVANTLPYAKVDPYTDHKSYFAALINTLNLEKVALTSITGAYGFKQLDANSFNGATSGIYVTQLADFDQFSQELRAVTQFDGPLNVVAGVFFATSEFAFDNTAVLIPVPPDPATGRFDSFHRENGFDGRTYSAFAELSWKALPTVEVSGGARWSREEKDSSQHQVYVHPLLRTIFPQGVRFRDKFSDEDISPQLTVTWTPNQDLMVYGAYKTGFKAGGYNLSQSILPSTRLEHGQFRSEKAKGFEGGVRAQLLERHLRLSLTAYDYDVDDLQNQIFDPATLAQVVANVGTLNTKGAELEADLSVPNVHGLELHGAVAYNKARYEDYVGSCYTGQTIAEGCTLLPNAAGAFTSQDFAGRQPPRAPKWAGRVGGSYTREVTDTLKILLGGDVTFSSRYFFNDALRPDMVQDSYARLDATIRLINEPAGWELALIGRNLSNERIVSSGNDVASQTGIGGTGTTVGRRADFSAMVERPRQIHVQVTKRF